jgi:hypothetical protein
MQLKIRSLVYFKGRSFSSPGMRAFCFACFTSSLTCGTVAASRQFPGSSQISLTKTSAVDQNQSRSRYKGSIAAAHHQTRHHQDLEAEGFGRLQTMEVWQCGELLGFT